MNTSTRRLRTILFSLILFTGLLLTNFADSTMVHVSAEGENLEQENENNISYANYEAQGAFTVASDFRFPIEYWYVVQDFGQWNSTFSGYHLAEDAYVAIGTPVYASGNGIIKYAGYASGYSGLVIIEHELSDQSKVTTLYGHLTNSTIQVNNGEQVSKGQLLGYIADPSDYGGTLPHIHYGIRDGGYSTSQICGHWPYVGYSQPCIGHEQYLNMWLDPTDFIINNLESTQVQFELSVNDKTPYFLKGERAGEWYSYTHEHNYIWAYVGGLSGNPWEPDCWAEFRPHLSQSGNYEVYAYFYADPQGSQQVPFEVHHDSGSEIIQVDQYAPKYFTWTEVKLGEWYFSANDDNRVSVTDATGEYYDGTTTLNIDQIVWIPSGATNQSPIAEAAIRSGSYGSFHGYDNPLTVTRGEEVELYFYADKDVNGDGQGSLDPDGWSDVENGVASGGKCEWNTDLNQGTPSFEWPIDNPPSAADCNIDVFPLRKTFNDPPGIYEYQLLRITDRKGAQSNVSRVRIEVVEPSQVGPLVHDDHEIDDDNSTSSGNNDGIVNCGEIIELNVILRNQGDTTATGVQATLSENDSYISITDDFETYPDIPGGQTRENGADYDFNVASDTPDGHIISFALDIYASNGGPWSDSFEVPVVCATSPEIDVRWYDNNQSISDGDMTPSTGDGTDFGSVNTSGEIETHTFKILNTGDDNLNLTGNPHVDINGCGYFEVISQPSTPVTPGNSHNFSVEFDPVSAGTCYATLSIDNNDSDEDPYDFKLQGTGLACYSLNTSSTPFESGDINANPSPNCDNGTKYTSGTSVTLTATSDTGWTFSNWNGDLTGSTNPDSITMYGDKTVTATFTQDEYNLTLDTVGGGSLTANPDQATYHYGDVVDLTATADPGWTFTVWSGDLSGSTNPESVTMDNDKTVTATFTQNEYTLIVNKNGNGSVTLNPEQNTYHYGDVVELTATADPGWTFDHWEGDLSGSTNPENLSINGNKTITTYFTTTACTFSGVIDLQGRDDDRSATFTAGAYSTTTDATGHYELAVPAGTYDVTAEMNLYLDGESLQVFCPAGGENQLPAVTLLGGDINDDCVINIQDLAFIGARFGLSDGAAGFDSRADVNADLTINILDITMAGANFSKVCPVAWP